MTPKKNLVQIRLTELERESWAVAAGGKGKLSSWIRNTCNQAAHPGGLSGPGGTLISEQQYPRTIEEAEQVTLDAIASEGSKITFETKPPAQKQHNEKCPRWMHHRPGSYCGSCKQVQK